MFADTDVHAGCDAGEERPGRKGQSARFGRETDVVENTRAAEQIHTMWIFIHDFSCDCLCVCACVWVCV